MQTRDELLLYAMKNYDNPGCRTLDEFESDYQKFSLIAKMIKKDDANVKLILNYIIMLYNVFQYDACTKLLFKKVDTEYWNKLKPFILYLNYMPEVITDLSVVSSNIGMNQQIVDELRKI